MTTAEAAKEWKVTRKTVATYCKEGLIPMAYKANNKWVIPNETTKPPITRSQAVVLMRDLELFKQGANPIRNCTVSDYKYLANNGFITDISDCREVGDVLRTAKITTDGYRLISDENRKKAKKTMNAIEGNACINLGVANVSVSFRHEVETN